MYVVRLAIRGFRGVRVGEVPMGRHVVLVGPNNSGKTTIIEALALLLGRDRLVRTLSEHDFYGSSPTAASRIVIVATISGFPHNDPEHSPLWFGADCGVEKWLNPLDRTL